MFADAATIPVGIVIAALVFEAVGRGPTGSDIMIALASTPFWIMAFVMKRLYTARVVDRRRDEIRLLAIASVGGIVAMVAIAFAAGLDVSRAWAVSVYSGAVGALLLQRMFARRAYERLRSNGRLVRRVAVVGTDSHAVALAAAAESKPANGYQIVGLIGPSRPAGDAPLPLLGPLDRATDILRAHSCGGVLVSLHSVNATDVNKLTRELTDEGFHVALSSGLRDIKLSRMRPQELDGQALVYVEPTIRTGWRMRAKRAFDVTIAATGLVLSAPLLLVASILIKLDDGGPIVFRQQRVGRNGRPFQILKLRTMSVDAEARRAEVLALNESDGPLFKASRDPRITRVGRFLRASSIDELPQFWNVIIGDMSVVGPRPALPSEVAQWDDELHGRLRVLPGITGLWQVSGRSDTGFDMYKRLDLHYVDNWSLVHDLDIVARTFVTVLARRGAC
jgi:exopolysaccharide biosynthesis polyprenyl glycosylphosphotransferase